MGAMIYKARRPLLPFLLIALGLWLLAGCLYVPAFDTLLQGQRASDQIGEAESNRPLKVRRATKEQVIGLLGEPHYVSSDGRRIAYTWKVVNGVFVWPLCFSAAKHEGARAIILRFDQYDVLESFELERYNAPLYAELEVSRPPVPHDMKPHRPPQGMWYRSYLATQPATSPVITE